MNKKVLALFVLLVFVVTGCSDEYTQKDISTNQKDFVLSYTTSQLVSGLTRSQIVLEDGEDQINTFYLLFFEYTSGGTGRFLEAIDLMESSSGPFAGSGNLNVTLPADSELTNSGKYKMLLCANIDDYTGINGVGDLAGYCTDKTETEVIRLLHTISGVTPGANEEKDNSNRMLSRNLPMSASLVKEGNVGNVAGELVRTVARLDVYSEAEGYELVSASIWNAYTEGFIWEDSFTNYKAARTERYYGVQTDNNQVVGGLYAFENFVSQPAQSDKVTTCLIVGLRNSSGEVEYFRTNVDVSGNLGQTIKRNNVYTTVIKSVQSQGYPDERSAYENDDSRLPGISFSDSQLQVPTVGGSTIGFTINSSSEWVAELIIEVGTKAGFDNAYAKQVIEGNGIVDNLKVFMPAYYGGVPARVIVRATIVGTKISAEMVVYQDPFYNGILVAVNTDGNGSLVDPTKNAYKEYVYNLGENMRNTYLFGQEGSIVNIPRGGFEFIESMKEEVAEQAKIFQIVSYPQNTVEMPRIYNQLQADRSKLLIIGHVTVSYTNKSLEQFEAVANAGYGKVTSVTLSAGTYRTFNSDALDHPLIQYLLNGAAGQANPDEIRLYGHSSTNGGLAAGTWPATFVPIIMSKGGSCVFGIDPTHQLILMSEPGLFGSSNSKNQNSKNYADENSSNTIFLNNFIAWMARVATEGGEFLDQFR